MRQNDVELKDEDISIKHRLHTSNTEGGKPPAIILRLTRREKRATIYDNRKKSLNKNRHDREEVPYPDAMIFEDVTPLRSRILYHLRNKENANKEKVYKFV